MKYNTNMYPIKIFFIFSILFTLNINAISAKDLTKKSTLIKVHVTPISESKAKVNIINSDIFPHIVLVKIFNSLEPEKIISEISTTVSGKASINIEARSVPNIYFDYPLGWTQHESIGDNRILNKNYEFQLPFLPGFKVKICQSSDGPQFTHGKEKIHAVDFCAPEKTPIVAAKDGSVIEVVDNNTNQGKDQNLLGQENKIRLIHEDGLISEYAHIVTGSANVKIGDEVKAGQQIALLGNVGYSSGPHLHFEVTEGSIKLTDRNLLYNVVPIKFTNSKHEEIRIIYNSTYTINGETVEDAIRGRLSPPSLHF